jgi:hypothetical protein
MFAGSRKQKHFDSSSTFVQKKTQKLNRPVADDSAKSAMGVSQGFEPEIALPAGNTPESQFNHDFSRVPVRKSQTAQIRQPEILLDSGLPLQIPARTENANIHVGIAGLFMPVVDRQRMLQHETIHSIHQQIAPQSETAAARGYAENLAARGEQSLQGLHAADFNVPVPASLSYPPQNYPPFTKVWIGSDGLIGEVVEQAITVRYYIKYDALGLTQQPTWQTYVCGKHDLPPIPDIVKKMKTLATLTAQLNNKIPAAAQAQRVSLIAIYGDKSNSGYRYVNGQGFIVVSEEEFNANQGESTVRHEASHGIFEGHSIGTVTGGTSAPDALALRFADLYSKLENTKQVPVPTTKFNKTSPPSLNAKGATATEAAGIIMVTDTLWTGAGGHPGGGVDEFFASAYAGFLQDKNLLQQIVQHYEKADAKIKPLATELFLLLDTVGNPGKYGKLSVPNPINNAKTTLSNVKPAPTFDTSHSVAGQFIDPTKLIGPATVLCPSSVPSNTGGGVSIDDLLNDTEKKQSDNKKPSTEKDKSAKP